MSHVDGVDGGIGYGVYGRSFRGGYGVSGYSDKRYGIGVYGSSIDGRGVTGISQLDYGVYGESRYYPGVCGRCSGGWGVYGESYEGYGMYGYSNRRIGVYGESCEGYGMYGRSTYSPSVFGDSNYGFGVHGYSYRNYGVVGYSDINYGIYAASRRGFAAYLDGYVRITGNVRIDGNLSVNGTKSFKIDHPLDPSNKYLYHSCVESPDMKNVYDGVVILDNKGEAEIDFPDWFGALNKDFCYQLTAIGAPGPNLYIAEEIPDGVTNYSNSSSNNKKNNNSSFKIAGGTSGMKVSWQVTGIRKDPYAKAHPIQVEEDKPDKERGYYIYPDLYGQPEEKGISRLLFPPEEEKQELLINK
jgi:hypothetical protein